LYLKHVAFLRFFSFSANAVLHCLFPCSQRIALPKYEVVPRRNHGKPRELSALNLPCLDEAAALNGGEPGEQTPPPQAGFCFLVVALTRLGSGSAYLGGIMLLRLRPSGFIEPCLPSPAERPPSGANWIHEIKHDGFRLMARWDPISIGIRLITRNGHDWAARYPLIVEAVNRLKVRSCLIDGEAVACDGNGLAVFERPAQDFGGDAREPAARKPAGSTIQSAPHASWRHRVPARLRHGPRRHRLEAAGLALRLGTLEGLAQVQEPKRAGSEAGGRGRLGQERVALKTRTHFAFRVDMWTDDGLVKGLVDELTA
jgi:ATP dependent DNA ligase domain